MMNGSFSLASTGFKNEQLTLLKEGWAIWVDYAVSRASFEDPWTTPPCESAAENYASSFLFLPHPPHLTDHPLSMFGG